MVTYSYDRRIVAAIQLSEEGEYYVIRGTYNELRDHLQTIKSQKVWRWDPNSKGWFARKQDIKPRQLTNIKRKLGIPAPSAPPKSQLTQDELESLKAKWGTRYEHIRVSGYADKLWIKLMRPVDPKGLAQLRGKYISHEGTWVFDREDVDPAELEKVLDNMERASEKQALEVEKARAQHESILGGNSKYFRWLGVSLGSTLQGIRALGETRAVSSILRGYGLKWNGSTWEATHTSVKDFKRLVEDLTERDDERKKALQEAQERREQEPATEKQVDFAMSLLSRISDQDWFDFDANMGSTRKPSRAHLQSMSKPALSQFIDSIKEELGSSYRRYC